MQNSIKAIITALAICLSGQAAGQAVVEGFGCNLNDGKTMDDLMEVAEHYASRRSSIDSDALQKMRSVVWTPVRGSVDVDLVWFNSNLSYSEWGEAADALAGTDVGQEILARFNTVITCEGSGLSANEVLFTNDTPFEDDGQVMIESYRCSLNPGKTLADSDKAIDAWRPAFEKAVQNAGVSSFVARRTPIISGTGFDLSYLGVWDDAATFAAVNEALMEDPDNRSDPLFAAAHRCQSALFTGQVVVQPAE